MEEKRDNPTLRRVAWWVVRTRQQYKTTRDAPTGNSYIIARLENNRVSFMPRHVQSGYARWKATEKAFLTWQSDISVKLWCRPAMSKRGTEVAASTIMWVKNSFLSQNYPKTLMISFLFTTANFTVLQDGERWAGSSWNSNMLINLDRCSVRYRQRSSKQKYTHNPPTA